MRVAIRAMVLVTLMMVGAGPAPAQEKGGPGPERKVLERLAGRWEFTGKVFLPGSESLKLEGTSEAAFLEGSDWLVSRGKGRANDEPFDMVVITCFDAGKGRFTGTGAHSAFPPHLTIDEGTYDEASRTLRWEESEALEPGTGAKVMTRAEDTFRDDDTLVSTSYIKRPGENEYVKWVEVTSRRRK